MTKRNKTDILAQEKINTKKLFAYSKKSINEIYTELSTETDGLSENAAQEKLDEIGLNKVVHEAPQPWYVQLILAFVNPFIIVLFVLAGVSLLTDVLLVAPSERSYRTVIAISTMVLISGILKFVQEYKSSKEAQRLKAMVKTTAAVRRKETGTYEIDMTLLVPGDIVELAAGDLVPADLRVLTCKDLFIGQSALTGESAPIEKVSDCSTEKADLSVTDIPDICLLGTNVISGSTVCVVVATGNETYFGAMAASLVGKRVVTSFEKGSTASAIF